MVEKASVNAVIYLKFCKRIYVNPMRHNWEWIRDYVVEKASVNAVIYLKFCERIYVNPMRHNWEWILRSLRVPAALLLGCKPSVSSEWEVG